MSTATETTGSATQKPFWRSSAGRSDRISQAGTLVSLLFIAGSIIVFNYFPDQVGYVKSADKPWTFVPLLSEHFPVYLPLLNAWWGLALAINLAHLWLRRWTPATRAADLGLAIFGLVILGRLISGPPVLALQDWTSLPDGLGYWLGHGGLWALFLLAALGVLKKLLALVRSGAGLTYNL